MGKHIREDGLIEYTGFWWKLALPELLLPVHLAVAVLIAIWGAMRFGTGLWRVGAGTVVGLAIWTLFEYAMHRWLLHHTRNPILRRIFWKALHAEHHGYRRMEDPDHHGVHVAIILPVFGAVAGTVALASSTGWGPSILAGWVAGYFVYEALHWVFHSGRRGRGLGSSRWVRGLWDAHTIHHLQRIDRNYGFVTLFWDRVFGTFAAADPPSRQS